jgi:1-deoxy-D-xylulose-5-phosphate reductoisomerase
VVNALVGMAGLEPTYYAIQAGRTIALANKETLVAGGSVIMDAAASKGVKILPVDSEHSAVFQCLEGYDHSQVKRIILTASGGPFRGKTKAELEDVTLEQALNHPRWKMGSKITIDSSTLMNKGFEVIEARWLFDVPASDIDVVIHPESIIHSMVEYDDRAVMAQLGLPDMKIPISLALSYPKRLPNTMPSLDLTDIAALTFEKPDTDTFVCLKLAYDALAAGDTYCTALNAANEVCVAAFLEGKIRYRDIGETLMHIMDIHIPSKRADLNEILRTDAAVREKTAGLLEKL